MRTKSPRKKYKKASVMQAWMQWVQRHCRMLQQKMTAKTSVDSIHISLWEVRGQDWSLERSQIREQTHLQKIHAPDPVECDAARDSGLDMERQVPTSAQSVVLREIASLASSIIYRQSLIGDHGTNFEKYISKRTISGGPHILSRVPTEVQRKVEVWIPVYRSTCKNWSCNASSGIFNPPAFLSQLMVMHSKIHKYRSDAIQAG
jgi:hypothetical protein